MYKCTHRDCDNPGVFEREHEATATQQLDQDGTITNEAYTLHGRASYVRCICGARAEWIDARQEELFAIEPALIV